MFENHAIIDLSWPIHTNMPVFPGILKTYLGVYVGHKDSFRPPNISSQTNIMVISDHAGTHIDAPLHFNPNGTGIESMPVDKMIGNAAMQDFSFKKSGEPVTLEEVKKNFESVGISPRNLTYVLFRTGAADYYHTDEYVAHYLEIRPDLVEWLLDQGIFVFGVDASAVDHAKDRGTHMLMRKRLFYQIENLRNLDKLPQDRIFTFFCAPMLLRDSSASPIRALALIPPI